MHLKFRKGNIQVEAPSNIAWVKYWGKKGLQVPVNPSISMTLRECSTRTSLSFQLNEERAEQTKLSFFFHGKPQDSFLPKIKTFLGRVREIYPFIDRLSCLEIRSENTFPHSSGIASSASGFCALAWGFETIASDLEEEEFNINRASESARLGSGSACRSVFGSFALWGEVEGFQEGSNSFATALGKDVHPLFQGSLNAICVIASKKKSVSSSVGHELMNEHPFKEARKAQARKNTQDLLRCLKKGDFLEAGRIIEEEAMALHSLMMTSKPSYTLMEPNTLAAIKLIRTFREEKGVPVFFTLDAGPNPHVIYLQENKKEVEDFLRNMIKPLCEDGRIIKDQIGQGPVVIEKSW